MGLITFDAKKVTISTDTELVLTCYDEALLGAGFTDEKLVDPYLSASDVQQKKGLKNKIKIFVSSFITEKEYGQNFIKFGEFKVHLMFNMECVYNLYKEAWITEIKKIDRSKWLPIGDLDEFDITSGKIHSPHVLIMHLALRMFAFSIRVGQGVDAFSLNYHMALDLFIAKLLAKTKFLYHNEHRLDSVGLFLGSVHRKWLNDLRHLLTSQSLLNAHETAFGEAENLLSKIETIITQQLCAYLDSEKTKGHLHPDLCQITLTNIHKKIILEAYKKKNFKQMINCDESFQKKETIIKWLSLKNYPDLDKIEKIYFLLEEVRINRTIVQKVREFVKLTGWIALLTGLIKLGPLNERLKMFCNQAVDILSISSNLLETNAGSALICLEASDLSKSYLDRAMVSTNFENLQNPKLLQLVYGEIEKGLHDIIQFRETYKLNLVDVDMAAKFTSPESMIKKGGNEPALLRHNQDSRSIDNTHSELSDKLSPFEPAGIKKQDKGSVFGASALGRKEKKLKPSTSQDASNDPKESIKMENISWKMDILSPDIVSIQPTVTSQTASAVMTDDQERVLKLTQIARQKAKEFRAGIFWNGPKKATLIDNAVDAVVDNLLQSRNWDLEAFETVKSPEDDMTLVESLGWHRLSSIWSDEERSPTTSLTQFKEQQRLMAEQNCADQEGNLPEYMV